MELDRSRMGKVLDVASRHFTGRARVIISVVNPKAGVARADLLTAAAPIDVAVGPGAVLYRLEMKSGDEFFEAPSSTSEIFHWAHACGEEELLEVRQHLEQFHGLASKQQESAGA